MTAPTPDPAAPATTAAPDAPPAPGAPAAAPPWGTPDEFDPEKAWSRIQQQSRDIDKLRTQILDAEPKLTEYNRLIEASKSDLERAQEAAKTAAERAELSDARAVKAEVKAIASAVFADPDDAAAFLDLKTYVTDAGEIDTAKIQADLADLLNRKPHLGKPQGDPRRAPAPNPALGSSASGAPDAGAVIAAAQKSGDWQTVIALENQKLIAPQR